MIFFLFFSCAQTESPDLLSPWPTDPYLLLKRCEKEEIEELQITCRVQAASDFGAINEESIGADICSKIKSKVWNEECHFRLGEELASAGNIMAGFLHCSHSGFYAMNCFTHIGRRKDDVFKDNFALANKSMEEIQESHAKMLDEAQKNIFNVPEKVKVSLLKDLTAQFGISVYFGRGSLEYSPADMNGLLGAAMRTGYAMEAARILSADGNASVENIIEVWNNPTHVDAVTATNATLHGRYHSGLISPYEHKLAKINLQGGGTRLISENPQEDITIAALEAMYWLEQTPSESFIPWMNNRSHLIRLTAAKLLRLSMTPELRKNPRFIQAKSEADGKVLWYFKQTLSKKKHRIKKPQ
ncbi:MAG: hypothetical protein CL916_11015 [Deltaproteobacteria bacterium]|nr:hypothetical protein [Deltaproteobacteria bacterium]